MRNFTKQICLSAAGMMMSLSASAADVVTAPMPGNLADGGISLSGDRLIKSGDRAREKARIVEGGWHSVGKGKWYEGLLTIFDEIDRGLSWEIDVEESDEVAGYYRFIPYCAGSPVAEIVGAPDEEYFYVDCSDPEKVVTEEFVAYRYFEHTYYFSQIVPENGFSQEMYGELENGAIYFPAQSFAYYEPESSTWWPVNFEGDFRIVLPGGEDIDDWKTVQETTFIDGFCGPYFHQRVERTPVTVQERHRNPGYYRLLGAFSSYGSDNELIIDARNPDFVTVPYQEAGFDHRERGRVVVYSHCENFISPTKYADWQAYSEAYPQYVATLRDGYIVFPPDAIVLHFPDWNPLSFTTNDDAAGESKVFVGTGSGVEEIDVDSDAPAEYYTLDGRRVSRPDRGLYIKRQGNRASKVIF